MRITFLVISVIAAGAIGLAVPSSAAAQNGPSSVTYEGGFELITNSCSEKQGMTLTKSAVRLTRRGKTVDVAISGVPTMTGSLRRGGRFKAETRRTDGGVEGRFTASGRANETRVQLVFVVEFYRGTTAVCTQSWDVTGARKK